MHYERDLLNLAMLLACSALVVAGYARLASRRSLGELWFSQRSLGTERKALLVGLLVLAILGPVLGMPLVLPPLALAALLLWLQPGSKEQALGSDGVLYGWGGHRFEDLQEWRLTGDHLRFRIRDEWAAVGVPAERREQLLQVLEQRVPERQSSFKN